MRAILRHSDGDAARKADGARHDSGKDEGRKTGNRTAANALERMARLAREQKQAEKGLLEQAADMLESADGASSPDVAPESETADQRAWGRSDAATQTPSGRDARYLEDIEGIVEQPQPDWPSLQELWPTLPAPLRGWIDALRLDIEDARTGAIRAADMSTRLLLHGPPGTGKSFIARAFAQSFGIPLISTSYARWGAYKDGHLDNVTFAMKRDFFLAGHFGPSVLFIDEIDTIPSRDSLASHNRDYWVAFTNALLEELSGSGGRSGNYILLAATNRRDALDPALLRSGRLEKQIELGAPATAEACAAMLRVHLRDDLPDAPLARVAGCLVGKPAADIEALVRRARHEARVARAPLALDHLFAAAEMDARSRDPAMDRTIALHEAGHGFAHVAMDLADRVSCSMSGVTAAESRRSVITPAAVERRLVALLAGRAAEEAILGAVSSGSGGHDESDLGKAHELAGDAVLSFGFSRRAPLHFIPRAARRSYPLLPRESEEIRSMVAAGYAHALALVRANRGAVVAIADALQQKRALEDSEIREIVNAHRGEGGKPRFRIRVNEDSQGSAIS